MLNTMNAKPRLLALIGPTAVGKTKLSLEIAEQFGCEIISGDSMQVYRGMDIGTAKITPEERQRAVHHMIDIHEPGYPFSVAEFQQRVRELVTEITARGKLPFLVGGTGLYVESVCYEYQFLEVGADEEFRQSQHLFAEQHGDEALHRKLQEVDPGSAAKLHPNDRRRVIRALEVYHLTGEPLSVHAASQKKESPYELCIVGLTMDRQQLYSRIEERIDLMMAEGLVDEVQRLLESGVPRGSVAMQGLGYKEIVSYLDGEITLDRAVELLKRDTRHFAKRQLSWFRHMRDIQWIDVTEPSNFSRHLDKFRDIITGKFVHDNEYNA
ncbi:tRNA (adenosine(37)-N6)-dimethylallyltransferase MiaA [Paenibacillus sp. FJAT-26967]|uniref:tRNA (adenosine(37)-N6)-dimethylallyltransferase MiaA n=1 Tax=Paenibacillus sp. FJAT-26967 TaxID=1729690 RepID=UPI00083901E7|nr:tRNA (adenosine(37)-N6)-dimethylallyltransferase MiaA [Paenibacillus sp. FJAT-26967]